MNLKIREWIDNEIRASGKTTFDFFSECYTKIHGVCKSNRIVIDANHYRSGRIVPTYVYSVYERLQAEIRVLPKRASEAYHKAGRLQ